MPVPAVAAYLHQHERKPLLRFITCGSVDDGKSTLIGRLLYDTKCCYDDQLAALERDSAPHGTQGANIDFALLVDGLAGRARAGHHHRCRLPFLRYRQAQVHRRRLPGPRAVHPQHGHRRVHRRSRGVLVDARKGLLTQTRGTATSSRCSASATCCWRSTRWTWSATTRRCSTHRRRLPRARRQLGIEPTCAAIPLSALRGDNVIARSHAMPWYDGPDAAEHLETVEIAAPTTANRRSACRCSGCAGRTRISAASPARSPPARSRRATKSWRCRRAGASRVARIVTADGDLPPKRARPGGDADAGRRDRHQPRRRARRPPTSAASVADQFAAHVLWMATNRCCRGAVLAEDRRAHRGCAGHRDQAQGRRQHPGASGGEALELNEVGYCNLHLTSRSPSSLRRQPRARRFHPDRPADQRHGRAGTLDFALRRAAQRALAAWMSTSRARRAKRQQRRAACGSPACRARANRPSPTWSRSACWRWAGTPICWTATTSATA
jgi:bifunctional enzyme CysN/CysC